MRQINKLSDVGEGPKSTSPEKRGFRGVLLLSLAITTVLGAPSVEARAPVIELGEVTLSQAQRDEVKKVLHSALREELGSNAFSGMRSRDRYVLSARLVELKTKPDSKSVRTTAVVSLVLRQQKSDSLHAMARGRATVQEHPKRVRVAETAALRAAVHSGMSRVSEAVAKQR